jgi:choline-sulfatase
MRSMGYCAVLVLLAGAAGPALADAPRRPNLLWICADDHAAYVYGAYGNRQVRTPNLDQLATQGMRFDRAYCNSPVCTASRQSFLTGRYPRTLGVTELSTPLPEGEVTLATLLRQAGYDTAAIGKMHFNSNYTHGFQDRLDLTDYQQALRRRGPQPLPAGIEVLPAWRPFRDPASIWLNSFCRPYGAVAADMSGTYLAQEATRYFQEHTHRPFFLMVSFYEPHSPFHFPIEYAGRHKPQEFTVPPVGPEDDWQIPAVFRPLTEAQKQGINAAYYTSVEFLDRNVGLVLQGLQRAGLADNTLVVYMGDHGYLLGQHGRFEKHCSYEPAVRAPLVLRYPGHIKPGQHTDALVEFIDLVPTILEYAGLERGAHLQGKSLLACLEGRAQRHRDRVVVEYAPNDEAMIRTERWKFIYSRGKRERRDGYATGRLLPGRTIQLFDEVSDPDEMHNLATKPEYQPLVAQFTARLAEHLKQTARQPELLPRTQDVHEILEYCLQPHDVVGRSEQKKRP